MKKINVLLADTQEIIRVGLRALLEQTTLYNVTGEAADSDHVLDLMASKQPQLMLLDPEGLAPAEITLIATLKKHYPELRIVVFTNNDDEEYFRKSIEYGASGYFLKSASAHDLLDGLEIIMGGEQYFGIHISRKLIEESVLCRKEPEQFTLPIHHKLTKRELEILRNITMGLTNAKIAEKLFISDRTVHNHRNNLMRKLEVHNTADMVRIAIEAGILNEFTN